MQSTNVYNGDQNPATKSYQITTFGGSALTSSSYDLVVSAFNWVGESAQSTALTTTPSAKTSNTNSVATGTGIEGNTDIIRANVDANLAVTAYDASNTAKTVGGDIYIAELNDYCLVSSNFYCYP